MEYLAPLLPLALVVVVIAIFCRVWIVDRPNGPRFICTDCGTKADPKDYTKGSILIELILWCCFFIPGIIYSAWRHSSRQKVCPACKRPSMIPLSTPTGQKLAGEYSPGAKGSQIPASNPVTISTSINKPRVKRVGLGAKFSSLSVNEKTALTCGGTLLLVVVVGFISLAGIEGPEPLPSVQPKVLSPAASPRVSAARKTSSVWLDGEKGKLIVLPTTTDVPKKDGTFDARKNDLEELCRDYVFYRDQILKHARAGDQEAANKDREAFQQVNTWLEAYSEEDMQKMFDRIGQR